MLYRGGVVRRRTTLDTESEGGVLKNFLSEFVVGSLAVAMVVLWLMIFVIGMKFAERVVQLLF